MADSFYVNALERLTGVSTQGTDHVAGLENLGAASDRLAGGRSASVSEADGVSLSSSYQESPGSTNARFNEAWSSITRGDTTYTFSDSKDAQGRYHAAVEAKANETVASFSGDMEDVREIRQRLLRGESLDSVLTDVREKRHDLNVAAAVAQNKSSATASAHDDRVDPSHKEASSVAYARDGSTANASAGTESAATATAREHSVAGASSDQGSMAGSVAEKGSQAVSSAFEQSLGWARAGDGSEATVSSSSRSTAEADADNHGVSRSEARTDASATSKARAGDAHAEAADGSMVRAESQQKDKYGKFEVGKDANTVWGALTKAGWSDAEIVEQGLVEKVARENKLKDAGTVMAGQQLRIETRPSHRPEADAVGRNGSEAEATASGPDSHAGILADDASQGKVSTGAHQTKDIKVAPERQSSLPTGGTFV